MAGEPDVKFRQRKRPKFMRKRLHSDDEAESASATPSDSASAPAPTSVSADVETSLALAEARRWRKQHDEKIRARKGITGTVSSKRNNALRGEPEEQEQAPEMKLAKEFVPQTGMVKDVVDKHMMEYIDRVLAESRNGATAARKQDNDATTTTTTTTAAPATTMTTTTAAPKAPAESYSLLPRERAPAGAGKLEEVDLGPDATRRNIEATEAAMRALRGEPPEEIPWDKQGMVGAFREGGAENPSWRKRKRNQYDDARRNMENSKRDELVEQVLRENRVFGYFHSVAYYSTTYDTSGKPDKEPNPNEPKPDEADDDRLVEQFRREYLDSQMSRARAPPAPSSSTTAFGAAGRGDDKPRGPKLGGSRSARAAMRAAEEKKDRLGGRKR
ncbi:uncharacterized protein K452DRAFT_354778 [Aplosporella prunicola CBS 121167]|uniref:Hepatocellular carcinoma-associated antigen 59-domain-containing protein n=1 Tax=Aplosporella prunicola CBS 121167 TaxID=1176127 RepID=A0A6A6BVJ6_9PEZI|nr:uncharacterized protein K452DRAFT_354778 [Aplosporella prunicola CBS 121167]KAF2147363.1 hypothetical protein K452DRAFT_354778 [Aplosporella prunicola CBS 121167]